MRTGLIAAAAGLIVMIFIIQNAQAVNISFLGAHLRLSLAVALVFAAIVRRSPANSFGSGRLHDRGP